MANLTKYGLLLIVIGLILSIISNTIMGVAKFDSGVGSIGGFFTFIGLILMLVGRKEYGKKHSQFMIYALILFIITFIITVIFVAMIVVSVISSRDLSSLKNILYIIPIASILSGIMYLLILYELEDKKGKTILYIAILTSIITSIIIIMILNPVFDKTIGSISIDTTTSTSEVQERTTELTKELTNKLYELSLIGIINNLLFLIAFYIPYKRINSGELASTKSSNLINPKRCMNCGRVNPSDSIMCAYCGKQLDGLKNYNTGYYQQKTGERVCPTCGRVIPFDAMICPYCTRKF